MTHFRRRARACGKTLIEMAVIISITSVVLSLATATLATLFRIERQLSGDLAQSVAVTRLATHLRADAHAALSAKVEDVCELSMPDGRRVRYATASPSITREVLRGEEVVHRDAFLLPRRAIAAFSAAGEMNRREIRVSIASADGPGRFGATPVRPVAISAAVNLHDQPAAKEEDG